MVPTERTLIKNGIVLSLDPQIGEVSGCDVLIDRDRIVAVGRGLEADGAEVIDASGMIVMPGFVDSHRHIWEGVLRNIGADVPLEGRSSYISHVLHKLAPAFRPEDAYMGNLISALGAIDAGITTPAGLVAHPGLTRAHRCGHPGVGGLRDAGRVRVRVPVVGQVGGASAELVRAGGHRALLDARTRCSPSRWRRPARSSPTSR